MVKRKNDAKIIPEEQKLLNRVVGYYQHSFTEDSRGRDFLEDRGITNKQTVEDFGVGFVDGGLKDILPDDPAVIKTLKGLGLFRAVKRTFSILLTNSVLDTLILYDQGFTNAIPACATNGLTDDLLEVLSNGVKEIYLCIDSGKTDEESIAKIAAQSKELGIVTYPVTLPDKNLNTFFKRRTPEEFETLLKSANPESIEQSDSFNKRKQTFYRSEEHGFAVGYGKRQYQVKGIQRGDTQLKATIKVSEDVSTNKPFELTTIDLYSSRSRHWFGKLCSGLFVEPEALVKEDISRLLQLVEQWKPNKKEDAKQELTKADKELALSFLEDENLLDELLTDFDALGVTGEETNKLVGYLAATSRKLSDPLSVLIQSRSAAGKSTLQDAILSLIPEEDFTKYTRITDQALFYKDEDALINKILAIEEAEGMGGAAYSIRNIQSAKKITVAATGKDQNGRMRTEEYTVNGPVCVMITTTATEIDQETASRFIFLTIDESAKMTDAIHRMQREAETLKGLIRKKNVEAITRKHYAVQRMLKPLVVVNPYAEYLSYPNSSLRARRDHKKYLGLIRAVTYLHQYQREIKSVEIDGSVVEYIEAKLRDIQTANRLSNVVLGQSMDELAKPSRTLLSKVYEMVKEISVNDGVGLDEVFFTRRLIREYTGWSDWQIRTHMKQLIELEYVNSRTGSLGKEYSYGLQYKGQSEEIDTCYLDLTSIEEIERLMIESKKAPEGETLHPEG